MNVIQVIGKQNESFAERPTVKAVIRRGGKILILNDGLLPGGGVDSGESYVQALQREV